MGEPDYEMKQVIQAYFVGAVMLFTISVGGTFLISLFKESVDLLVPLKTLTLYSIFAFVLLDYLSYRFMDGLKKFAVLSLLLMVEIAVIAASVTHIVSFFGESSYYSLGGYPPAFKIFPSMSLVFAIVGVFVLVFYAVDLDPEREQREDVEGKDEQRDDGREDGEDGD